MAVEAVEISSGFARRIEAQDEFIRNRNRVVKWRATPMLKVPKQGRMNKKNPKVDQFIRKAEKWKKEFVKLRSIALASGLSEELKWRLPCYSLGDGNVVIIQGFKEYCAVMFFKGALLRDARGVLVAPGNTQAGRQIRFTGVQEIAQLQPTIKAYIREAIEVEKAGLKVELKKEFAVPAEFQAKLDQNGALRAAFQALTPGRQRAYLFYFSEAKQAKTRESRIAACVPRILNGKGMNDG
jgi:uncharacterized protein YdeI (YjbR/CyaY-like superfamily)